MTYVTQRNSATAQQRNSATAQQRNRRLFLNLIALIFALNPIFSQTINLFSNSSVQMNELDTQLVNALNSEIGIDLHYAEIKNIYTETPSIGSIFNHYEFDSATNSNITYQFEVSQVQHIGQGEYNWWAMPLDGKNAELLIVKNSGIVGGYLRIENIVYHIIPVDSGSVIKAKRLISELSNDYFQNPFCMDSLDYHPQETEGPGSGGGNDDPNSCENAQTCDGNFDILVLLDSTAVKWTKKFGRHHHSHSQPIEFGYILLRTRLSYLNMALARSQINGKATFKIYNYNFNFDTITVSDALRIENDKNNLKSNSEVKNLKLQFHSDLVVLITNKNYGDIQGIASEIGAESGNAHAITTLKLDFIYPEVFTHEVGHLLKGRHNRIPNGGNDNTPDCNHGLAFNNLDYTKSYRTIVCRPHPADQVIANFSNPDVSIESKFVLSQGWINRWTGTDDNNNAGKIKSHICNISRIDVYDELDPKFDRNIKEVCPALDTFELCFQTTLPDLNRPMQPSYHYIWRWNTTTNWPGDEEHNKNIYLTFEPCYAIPIFVIQASQFFIHVKMCSDDNLDDCIYYHTGLIKKNANPPCNSHLYQLRKAHPDMADIINEPTEHINDEYAEDDLLNLKMLFLTNTFGQQINTPNFNIDQSINTFNFSDQLIPGIYYAHFIRHDKSILTKKLIIFNQN